MIATLRAHTPGGQSFSAGVVQRDRRGPATPADLLAAADKALYRATQGARNRVVAAPGPAREARAGAPRIGAAGFLTRDATQCA